MGCMFDMPVLKLRPFLEFNDLLLSFIIQWNIMQLSWMLKNNLLKYFIFPKIIFYFIVLSDVLPNSFLFKNWKTLTDFIWNCKKRRINIKMLCKPSKRFGQSFWNRKLYWDAFQLSENLKVSTHWPQVWLDNFRAIIWIPPPPQYNLEQ